MRYRNKVTSRDNVISHVRAEKTPVTRVAESGEFISLILRTSTNEIFMHNSREIVIEIILQRVNQNR